MPNSETRNPRKNPLIVNFLISDLLKAYSGSLAVFILTNNVRTIVKRMKTEKITQSLLEHLLIPRIESND